MIKKSFVFSVFLCLIVGTSHAQSEYTILHTFNATAGQYPAGNLTLSGKTLYGTTDVGGKNDSGCIFSIDTTGNNFKDIYDFGGSGNGAFPFGGSLLLSGHKLYGMTLAGGASDSGCVFSIDTNGAGYKDLLDFTGPNGSQPQGGCLSLSGAKLLGLTYGGGTDHLGVIFTVDTAGHNYKNLYIFTGGSAGGNPYGGVTLIKDKLFGMSSAGAHGDGNVFSIDSNGTNYTDLYDFSGTDGNAPNDLLTLMGNKFFGMTYGGGAGSNGNVFSIDTNGGGFFDILDFTGMNSPAFGQYPYADVIFSNGYLYGTTSQGGVNDSGTVFKVDTSGNYYTDLYDFSGTANGDAPLGDLVVVGRTLYGTAYTGGSTDDGVIFRIKDKATTGINNLKNQASLTIYPNPNNGQFTIKSSVGGASTVEIYNVLGEKVFTKSLSTTEGTNTIGISNQSSGVYLYRVISVTGDLLGEGKISLQK